MQISCNDPKLVTVATVLLLTQVSVSSNNILNLDAALSELGIVPEAAELPIPRYLAELRARV